MRIIKNELKKIFNIKSLIVVLVMSFIIYDMFISFHIEYFPNGRTDVYDIAKEFIEEEGVNASKVGVDYFLNLKKKYIEESNNYLLNNPVAKELGISTYEKLQEFETIKTENDNDEYERKAVELHHNIMFKEEVDSFWKVQGADYFIMGYNMKNISDSPLSEKQNERVNEVNSREDYRDVMPNFVLINYNEFIFNY